MEWIALAMIIAVVLDLFFGDPSIIPHPVVIIGKLISKLEKWLRAHFPESDKGEFRAGVVMAVLIPVVTFVVTAGVCAIAWWIHPVVYLCVQSFWCWQALAMRGLRDESRNVLECLMHKDLDASRRAVGRIVGRDTAELTEAGVAKACIETIAENFSDGVAAPLFYMMIGGAPLALTYKSINTMDSMLGYKNEQYLFFGRAAARLDDVVNYIPSRLAALLWILSAGLCGENMRESWRIWVRDRRNHASPNSAQTESACAGALGVQLAGPASYFGTVYDKPTIGDDIHPVVPQDIIRTLRMLVVASALAAIAVVVIRIVVWGVIFPEALI